MNATEGHSPAYCYSFKTRVALLLSKSTLIFDLFYCATLPPISDSAEQLRHELRSQDYLLTLDTDAGAQLATCGRPASIVIE